jgi:hypothetical protein
MRKDGLQRGGVRSFPIFAWESPLAASEVRYTGEFLDSK